jgi:hypothetical protein
MTEDFISARLAQIEREGRLLWTFFLALPPSDPLHFRILLLYRELVLNADNLMRMDEEEALAWDAQYEGVVQAAQRRVV